MVYRGAVSSSTFEITARSYIHDVLDGIILVVIARSEQSESVEPAPRVSPAPGKGRIARAHFSFPPFPGYSSSMDGTSEPAHSDAGFSGAVKSTKSRRGQDQLGGRKATRKNAHNAHRRP